jgi:acetyl-CoA carboxylase carboxyltransferase component
MEGKNAKLFVNSPNALAGNYTEKCDTASAEFQSSEAGLVDVVADEASIFSQIRQLISMLPSNNEDDASYEECTDDLNRAAAELSGCAKDTAAALSIIADDNVFFELKENYAKDMVTGFIRLNGMTVGCVANRSEILGEDGKAAEKMDEALTPNGCEKAASFISFCDAFNIPVLSLTNVKGYAACTCCEKRIAKAVAQLTYAFANATVPKVNVIVGNALGTAAIAMNAKAIGADITIAWSDAQIGAMNAQDAAKIMYDGESADVIKEKAAEYAALQTSAQGAAKRGYVDQIIDAGDTRKYVIGAFEMLFAKREERPAKKHGTV